MTSSKSVVRVGDIQQRILMIRGEKIVLDVDLAEFYGMATKRLNEQVKRNKERFPEDFGFRLTEEEKTEVVAKCDHLHKLKNSPALPYAFTEHWTGSRDECIRSSCVCCDATGSSSKRAIDAQA